MRRVSVIIPTYNRKHTLLRAIESVFAQDYPVSEIIVVDDGSTDGTREMLNMLSDRVTCLTNEVNLGSQASRNRGIAASRGDTLAFLDSDDRWRADKIRLQVEALDAFGANDLFCVTCGHAQGKATFIPPRSVRMESVLVHNLIGPTSNILISRRLFDLVGAFDAAMPSCQDWELFVRILEHVPIIGVQQVLTFQDTDSGTRISANRQKVIAGHRVIYQRARGSGAYRTLPAGRRMAIRVRQELALLKRVSLGSFG